MEERRGPLAGASSVKKAKGKKAIGEVELGRKAMRKGGRRYLEIGVMFFLDLGRELEERQLGEVNGLCFTMLEVYEGAAWPHP